MITSFYRWALACLAVLLLALPAAADYYEVGWSTRQDGNLKMWWTKNGVRWPSQHPFVDIDIVIAPNTYVYSNIAPDKSINDHHTRWRVTSTGKTTDTHAQAGAVAPYGSYYNLLVNHSNTNSITWYDLADMTETFDVSVTVDLVTWGDYLMGAPAPDPMATFLFDGAGLCPELPGFEATNATLGTPFTGEMFIAATTELSLGELPGDFDMNARINADDLMLLCSVLGTPDLAFDVTDDGLVNEDDVYEWITNLVPIGDNWGTISGDINLDGAVDAGDLAIMGANFGQPTPTCWVAGDINLDGWVDAGDLALFGGNFGTIVHPVPEPASAAMLLCGVVVAIRRRRRA
jgi:hypothetical protein